MPGTANQTKEFFKKDNLRTLLQAEQKEEAH